MDSRPFRQEPLQSLSPIGRVLFSKFGRGEIRDPPFQCIHQAFEFQARSHPDYIAVEDLHETITYAHLDRQANCLAACLRERGVFPGTRVALLVERSICMVVGILAVLKAGAAYVPLDGNVVSSSTLTHALSDSDASLVTIIHTMHRHCAGKTLGIGLPTPNNTVYILDEHMKPAKIGDIGILWAGGAGITRGYLNQPGRNAELYKRDPFLNDGRWYPNGGLEHLGRLDDQVKVKGFRVELDGVAAAMETTPGVKLAAAILIDGELWGFFFPPDIGEDIVKASASRVQPYYAVPTKYIPLKKFPTTINGKIDKVALRKLALKSSLYIAQSPPMHLLTPDAKIPKLPPVYPLVISNKRQSKESQASRYSDIERPPSQISQISSSNITPPSMPPRSKNRASPEQYSCFVSSSQYHSSRPSPSPPPPVPTRSKERPITPQREVNYRPSSSEADQECPPPSPSIYSPPPMHSRSRERQYWNRSVESIQQLVTEVSRRTPPRSTPPPQIIKIDRRTPSPKAASPVSSYHRTVSYHDTDKILYNEQQLPGHVEILLNLPITKEIEPSALEGQTSIWAGYKRDILPQKSRGFFGDLKHRVASRCRRFFGLVFFLNILVLIGIASNGSSVIKINEAVVANLFISILMRQDYVIDAFYLVFTSVPACWPLWIRTAAAGVHHIGGVHSGAGAASLVWQLYYTVQATRDMIGFKVRLAL
ncbi:hypothetical protein H0H81_011282 [Sphagnurus paluster]|uniref:AMP-dependent synthetase/ligase domain-containing protein n=1 Tax=Sphagnurus paluster TaxID=117069 RepID=A0A9P7GN56_9AGAR|nr:hypothetical protein H0H81_011282 [Sphagnurus paluster]